MRRLTIWLAWALALLAGVGIGLAVHTAEYDRGLRDGRAWAERETNYLRAALAQDEHDLGSRRAVCRGAEYDRGLHDGHAWAVREINQLGAAIARKEADTVACADTLQHVMRECGNRSEGNGGDAGGAAE